MRSGPLQMLVTAMDHSEYVRPHRHRAHLPGTLREKDPVALLKRDGSCLRVVVQSLFVFENLGRRQVTEVGCGDICAVTGVEGVDIGDTLADVELPEMLPLITIDEADAHPDLHCPMTAPTMARMGST